MTAPAATLREDSPAAPLTGESAITNAEIDVSCRWPVLLLFLGATGWLLLGTVLNLISFIKLHSPGVLSDCAWLTLGRVRPASINALLYGCASQAGLAVLLWILCRLGRARLYLPVPAIVATFFWNLGVTVGVLGIMAGGSTGFEWLEMPRYASPILFIAYAVIGLSAAVTFHFRTERSLYVSQWYLLAALFWFPWIYSAANLLLVFEPVRGTLQSVINAWFVNNLLGLWLTPIALGGVFYFIPKLVGRPLYSRSLAALGFWTLAFATNWTGLTPLIGGPVPRWMTSASTAACLLMVVPLITAAVNWHLTLAQDCGKTNASGARSNPVLHFILAGAFSYLVVTLGGICLGCPVIAARVQFTYVPVALKYLAVFGFVGLTLFGCAYDIVPRLVQLEWPKPSLIRLHFKLTVIGVALLFVGLTFGGLIQGGKMQDPAIPFVLVTKSTGLWVGLGTLGLALLLAGQIVFIVHGAALLREFCARHCAWVCDLCCPPDTENSGRES